MCKVQSQPEIMWYLSELIRAQFENREPAQIPDTIDVEQLKKIAAESQMYYLIMGSLIKLNLSDEVKATLRPAIMKSTMKTLQQVCSARDIQVAFEEKGIKNQVLKGAVMKQIYPRPEMREMSDIDFMVYEASFEQAEAIMIDMGYDKLQEIKHHVIFRKSPYLVFEMHWSLYEQTVDKEQYLYYKDQFRAKLKDGCKYTYEFSKEDFYVYLISHMAKHFYENGCGIRNLVDIYVYMEKYNDILDKEYIKRELEKCGLTAFELHARKLAYIWLNKEESTEFYNQMFLYMLDCGIYGKSENGIWGQMAKVEAGLDNTDKDSFLHYYFPSKTYMKEYYPWVEKYSFLLPVAWIQRGIHGLMNKESRERIKMMDDTDKYMITKTIYQELNLNFSK